MERTNMKTQHVATIYFETDGKTDVDNVVAMAAERMEQIFSVRISDTHVEDVEDRAVTAARAVDTMVEEYNKKDAENTLKLNELRRP
jgi:hypothetical protein